MLLQYETTKHIGEGMSTKFFSTMLSFLGIGTLEAALTKSKHGTIWTDEWCQSCL